MNTNDGPSRQQVDPRSRSIAAGLRAREIAKARAKERAARAQAREAEKIRRRRQRHQGTRSRVEIHRRAAETELTFRGPHLSTDLWVWTMFFALTMFVPVFVLGLFFPWYAAALLAVSIGGWLALVYRPTRVIVTDLGYLEVRRWLRSIGTRDQLELKVDAGRGDERFALECYVHFDDDHFWTARRLTAQDVAKVRRFGSMISAEPEQGEHEGGYREAA